MHRAVARLPSLPDLALVDGNQPPRLPCPVRCVIGGDALSLSIAAASIVAKVIRDRAMTRLSVSASLPMAGTPTPATPPRRTAPPSPGTAPAATTAPPSARFASTTPGLDAELELAVTAD